MPPRCAGYSVCNEFAHGPNPKTVERATPEGRWISWLNLVLRLHTAWILQSFNASLLRHFFRTYLDRTR